MGKQNKQRIGLTPLPEWNILPPDWGKELRAWGPPLQAGDILPPEWRALEDWRPATLEEIRLDLDSINLKLSDWEPLDISWEPPAIDWSPGEIKF